MKKIAICALITLVALQVHASSFCVDYTSKICPQTPDFTNCDDQLIKAYTGNLYGPLNSYLRGLNSEIECKSLGESLKVTLLKLPPVRKMRVYRGNKYLEVLKHLKKGECYSDKAFVSTSKDLATASYYFAPNENYILFQIDVKSGRDITKYAYGNEEEVLLLPNTYLRLTGISLYDRKKLYLFEEVGQQDCMN